MRSADHFNDTSGLVEDRLSCTRPLGPEASSRLGKDEAQGEAFLRAGVAALLARLHHKTTLRIATGDQAWTLAFDPDAPFSGLLSTGGAVPADDAAAVDGYVEIVLNAEGPATARPAFRAERETQSGTWKISLTVSDWSQSQAERTLRYLATLLESAARDPHHPAGSLQLLNEPEALELYRSLNATETRYPRVRVQDLITEQAQIDPTADAVVFAGAPTSYATLEKESDRLAVVLAGMGADRQHPVALAMPRSEQVFIAMLATLKAGSFFVPLDPSHPQQRLIGILEECKPAVVMVTAATAPIFAGHAMPLFVPGTEAVKTVYREASGRVAGQGWIEAGPEDVAYTIYTSGTTGKPKGVMVPQRALVNFVSAAQRVPGLKRGDRILAVATFSFDMSMMDIFLPLATGAAVVIASEQDARDPARLAQLLEQERITCMQATPTTWRMLLSHGWKGKKGMRMLAGGEALPRDLANALIGLDVDPGGEGCGELWNCYGPTETTVYSSFQRVHAGDGLVPIGPPIANTSFYIADAEGKLLPPEVAGELYIGGDGVALGYFERPELDREKFIANPWIRDSKQRLFCTGDVARVRPDGALDFFGRLDQQVKLRGYRIELGEIESVLREDQPGEPWLVAYVTVTAAYGGLDVMALRGFAAERLPAYMLPARFVVLTQLPLTQSGKVDKRTLQQMPAPQETARDPAAETPADGIEASLLKVFRDVLRSPSFGFDDSFFDHGGYSLLAVKLFARIANTLGTELPITALFDAPTVRSLATLLREGTSLATIVPVVPRRAGGDEPPFFLVQSYLLYGLAGSMVPETRPVLGIREAESFNSVGVPLAERVTTCADAIQRIYPRGLVHLGGWCAAATLTIEIARRLQEQGRTIGMLALFDAEAPGFVPRPASGNPRLARLRATLKYHASRLRRLGWAGRFEYLLERATQQTMQCVEWIYMRHRGAVGRLQHALPFLPNAFFYNRWTQLRAEEHPGLQPIDAKVYLFRASDVVHVPGSDEAMGWREIARGGAEVIFVPGHHESMFHEPQLSTLREEFRQAMLKVEPASPFPNNGSSGQRERAS